MITKRKFLSTGILGAIIGFFTTKLFGSQDTKITNFYPYPNPKNFCCGNKPQITINSLHNLQKQPDESPMYRIKSCLCCYGKIDTKEQRDYIDSVEKDIDIQHYYLEGTLEELMYKQHRQMLSLMARAIAEHTDNKHLNLDHIELLKEFIQKYKITNINT